MSDAFSYALFITAVGMTLVFGTILLIWALIWALVRLTTPPAPAEFTPEVMALENLHNQRRTVAGIAVITALALRQSKVREQPPIPPLPPTAIISAWQAVMRQNQLRRRDRR